MTEKMTAGQIVDADIASLEAMGEHLAKIIGRKEMRPQTFDLAVSVSFDLKGRLSFALQKREGETITGSRSLSVISLRINDIYPPLEEETPPPEKAKAKRVDGPGGD